MPFFSEKFSGTTLAPKESSAGGYLNPSKIEDGGNIRFAILSEEPLEGFEVWFTRPDGSMTKRITPEEPDAALLAQLEAEIGATVVERDGRKAIKPCSSFFVYEYESSEVKVFSANQKTLLSDLARLTSIEDYADLSMWDVMITRTGKGTDTKYGVMMVPSKRATPKIAKEVIEAWDEACSSGADLEALYEGGNPFAPKK